ncbi:cation diffusion facilitator family transporter [Corynebacterium sp. TAE3-ERU12]|uniref:cation diffusion facilitator family transporter n=1 Tax=Corynebacterium sp. TAE3-ERU12 TaxID=2849491 RepID=UPI001C47E4ED|nr:cation diffusion facilitator family transporter [Corynebacterium sp. TAE3-ERU12]MBV7295627.1 cation diffusion facilitator family transporter [Corynebacterium sp. TAE3-ERU12]
MHDHHDHQHHVPDSPRRLIAVVTLTFIIFLAEAIGGVLSGSLALLADAGHMLTDAAGLVMALIALFIGRRKATPESTFGLRRAEVIAALLNAITVLAIGVVIAIGAVRRLSSGTADIHTGTMITVAVVGLVANLIGMMLLAKPAAGSVNVRGAYLHVLVDALGSVAVIISGVVIVFTGWTAIDGIVSIILAGLIIPRSLQLLWRCVGILMERTPEGIDTEEVRSAIAEIDGVDEVHDLHVWSVSGTEILLSAHVAADGNTDCGLLDAIQQMLHDRFEIEHSTIQLEEPGHSSHEHELHP